MKLAGNYEIKNLISENDLFRTVKTVYKPRENCRITDWNTFLKVRPGRFFENTIR